MGNKLPKEQQKQEQAKQITGKAPPTKSAVPARPKCRIFKLKTKLLGRY